MARPNKDARCGYTLGARLLSPKAGPQWGPRFQQTPPPPIPSVLTKTNAACRPDNEPIENIKVKFLMGVHSTYPARERTLNCQQVCLGPSFSTSSPSPPSPPSPLSPSPQSVLSLLSSRFVRFASTIPLNHFSAALPGCGTEGCDAVRLEADLRTRTSRRPDDVLMRSRPTRGQQGRRNALHPAAQEPAERSVPLRAQSLIVTSALSSSLLCARIGATRSQ
jgi:hypothetical protein